MQIIIDEEAHLQHLLVLKSGEQVEQFGFHLFQGDDEVIDRVVLLPQVGRHGSVYHHVGQVDVPLDQVHVLQEFLILRGDLLGLLLLRSVMMLRWLRL